MSMSCLLSYEASAHSQALMDVDHRLPMLRVLSSVLELTFSLNRAEVSSAHSMGYTPCSMLLP